MTLLISDANILIDMESAELLPVLFKLPMDIGIPDILYHEEIQPASPNLEALGLHIMELTGEFIAYAFDLTARYK